MTGDPQPGGPDSGGPDSGGPDSGGPDSAGPDSQSSRGWLEDNRAHWDEATAVHAASAFYDLDGFRAGRDDLRPFEDGELGSVADLDLLHLQCHLGTDTLSLARRGARVVGLDFSAASVAAATALAADCGLAAEFVCADVYDAPAALGGRTFDVVYTGVGALCWLPDLDRWAAVVAALLRPGGVLYLVEIHPLSQAVWPDGRTITDDVMGGGFARDDGTGEDDHDYAEPGAELAAAVTWARNWSVAEVVTAVLGAGLHLELLGEQDLTDNPLPWLVRGPDRLFRFPPGFPRYPVTFSLRARSPAGA